MTASRAKTVEKFHRGAIGDKRFFAADVVLLRISISRRFDSAHLKLLQLTRRTCHVLRGDGALYVAEFANDRVLRISHAALGLGDLNGDNVVSLLNVCPFVNAISTATFISAADLNGDGIVNLLNVGPFIVLLLCG